MSETPAHRVRRGLKHPVIDADGHWLELQPIFLEYLGQVAGGKGVDRYKSLASTYLGYDWYRMSPAERARNRMTRAPWWQLPSNAQDRTGAMVPKFFHARLDDLGIDFALVYPSLGFSLPRMPDDDMRRAIVRAYNVMAADMFRPYADRMTPAGVCALNTPAEAIEEAEYAVRTLGLKVLVMNCTVPRKVEADAEWQPDPGKRRVYIDNLGMDSPYDYDPVWARMVELKVAVTNHNGSMGWPDRSSPTSFVGNHLGHFAQSHHAFARGLFMGGVTQRFPTLKFGFLEGGVGWACNLHADLIGHWKKRNKIALNQNLDPAKLDLVEVRRLMKQYTAGDRRFEGRIDDILARNLHFVHDKSQAELSARDMQEDEFGHVKIRTPADITRLFGDNFYFGCEADDPITAWAFDPRMGVRLKAIMGSDISHFDVTDATEVLEEAWEMVEHGLITEENFREFTFSNAVELHGGMNPDFFKGTVVERAAQEVLAQSAPAARQTGTAPAKAA
jgi:predicted TIM-barrel fold metal-dependent hydrolase